VTLTFQFTGNGGPKVLHTKTFQFTVQANGDGTTETSPVQQIEGHITESGLETSSEQDSSLTRTSPLVSLMSVPADQITLDEELVLTAESTGAYSSYWLRITSVPGMTLVGALPSGWGQGSSTTSIKVPIATFAQAGQDGAIVITAFVEWSVIDPTRRLTRGLQNENDEIPPTGTATYEVSVSLDPASVEAATAGGYATYTVSATLIAATGAMAAIAVI
jgi:hypothetical protein